MRNRHQSLLAAALTVAVLIACSSSPEAWAAATDDQVFRTLPPHTEAVIGVDFATLRTSFLYERFKDQMGIKESDLDEVSMETGFDPRRDLDSVAVAMWGEPSAEAAVILARGRFEFNDELMSELKVLGRHRGVTIYQGPDWNHGAGPEGAALAFPESGTAILGPHSEVVNAIERRMAGGPSLMDNVVLTARAREAEGEGQLWMVSSAPGALTRAVPDGLDERQVRIVQILGSMHETIAALDLMHGFRLSFAGRADTVEDAGMLAEAARAMVALARISLPAEERDLMQLLDQVHIGDSGERFEASVDLDRLQVEQLLEKMDSRGGNAEAAE